VRGILGISVRNGRPLFSPMSTICRAIFRTRLAGVSANVRFRTGAAPIAMTRPAAATMARPRHALIPESVSAPRHLRTGRALRAYGCGGHGATWRRACDSLEFECSDCDLHVVSIAPPHNLGRRGRRRRRPKQRMAILYRKRSRSCRLQASCECLPEPGAVLFAFGPDRLPLHPSLHLCRRNQADHPLTIR
jgi:hypothetical protein